MTDTPPPPRRDDQFGVVIDTSTPPAGRDELLRKINTKLAWIIFLLVLLVLNTCELADDVEDAVRGRSATDAATMEAARQETR